MSTSFKAAIQSYKKEDVHQLLMNITNTQDYIEGTSGIFLRLGKENERDLVPKLVQDWSEAFEQISKKSDNLKKFISFFYLANDIIQKCNQNQCPSFKQFFKDVLTQPITFSLNHSSEKFRNDVKSVLEVWRQRKIYNKDFIKSLLSLARSPQEIQSTAQEPKQQNDESNNSAKGSDAIAKEAKPSGENKGLPDNFVDIPSDFLNFCQSYKSMRKWTEKSEENRKKLRIIDGTARTDIDWTDFDCNLAEYKRCLGLEQKYRAASLKSAKEILKTMEISHIKRVSDLKTILATKENIESIERKFLDNR